MQSQNSQRQKEVATPPQSQRARGENATNAERNAQPQQQEAANRIPAQQVFAAASPATETESSEARSDQFVRSGFGRTTRRGGTAPGAKPKVTEQNVYQDLKSKSKVARAFMALKPTLIAGKVRANTKVEHQGTETKSKAEKAKAAARKEGQQWAMIGKTAGKLAALAVRNEKGKEAGKYGTDPTAQLNKSSPGRWLAKSSLNKVFNTESREDLKKSFTAYLDSTRPGSSVDVGMATNVKWGPRIPIGSILALPVGPTIGLDVNHDRTTGFKIERQDDGNFSIKLKYEQADGAGLRASIAPGIGDVADPAENTFALAAVSAGGSHKEEHSVTIKDQSLERTAEFFKLYIDHDISEDQGDDAVHGKKSTNKFSAWIAAGPGVYADSIGEANVGGFATLSVKKELGGTDKTYKLQDSPTGDGTKVKVDIKKEKVESEPVFWNGDASTDAGLGWGLSQVRDGIDLNPAIEPAPAAAAGAPAPEVGDVTGSFNVAARHQNVAGEGAALTRSKEGSNPKDKKVSERQANAPLSEMTAKRSVIPTRRERWAAEGGSGLKPEALFGKERAAKIMNRAISTLKDSTGQDYDVRKRNLKFDAKMTVKPEAFEELEKAAKREAPDNHEAVLADKLKSILKNPKMFKDRIDFDVSVTESKTYGQGAKFGVPFIAGVVEKADITFERTFDLGNVDNENTLFYSRQEFEETYGAPKKQIPSGVELPERNTVSTPPGLATIQEEEESIEENAAPANEAPASVTTFTQQDLDDILAPTNRRD
ncbi:hypothetical protein AB838_05840 [Rhodobacteraceae bacterium (ex Bugula neritina AB1)]|nr:hypothetical protein AB838_05840 [Rhodobacteraceae bacterium (ex Bugula neritina AB1)]